MDLCSDLKVKVAGRTLSAHKFVLAARSDAWSLANLASTAELDLSGEPAPGNARSVFPKGQLGLALKLCSAPSSPFVRCLKFGLGDCKAEVAMAMLRWAYTDELELTEDDAFLIDLMKLANRFQLQVLRERWVDTLARLSDAPAAA